MIEYKTLESKDFAYMQDTVKTFRHQDITDDKAINFLSNKTNIVSVALDDNNVVGYLLSYRLERMDNGNDFLIAYHLFVKDDHQRLGIGRHLMQDVIDYANKEKLHYILLVTQTNNEPANKLYKSLGGYNHPDDKEVYFWYITGKPLDHSKKENN